VGALDGAEELRDRGTKKNAPAGFGGLPGHLWRRMLVVGFDRRGDVTKLRVKVCLIEPRSLASQRKAPRRILARPSRASFAKTRTRPSVRVWGTKGGVSGTLIWLGEPKKLRGLHLGNSIGAPKVPHGTSCSLLLDTTRRRRLSSITGASSRRVMGVPAGPAKKKSPAPGAGGA
jgi:hypothetical protein